MNDNAELSSRYLAAFDKLTEDFVTTFSRYDAARFNAPRAEGAWSPGQLVEHLLRSEKGILALIGGLAAPPAPGRRPDDKCAAIDGEGFRETRERFEAPERLRPTAERYAPAETLDRFVDRRADLRVAFEFSDDVGAVVESYVHFVFGEMTRLEWFYFAAAHGERHRRQFQRSALAAGR